MSLALILVIGCAGPVTPPAASPAPLSDPGAAAGGASPDVVGAGRPVRVERLVAGLEAPTQMIVGPDDRLWVAQLAGPENAGTGQVVAVDPDSGAREVLVDGLDKPTGIAWLDGSLWIATPTALLRARGNPPDRPRQYLAGLPNNGRSNGTLTVSPDDRLLYETSGRERAGGAVAGSGALWLIDPNAQVPTAPVQVASGLKNAYAHVYDASGQLWTTEIAEPIGGTAAPDELNRVVAGVDYGWPSCVGEREPVAAFGGDEQRCRETGLPHTTFEPVGATPTAVVVSPFDPDQLIVALWNASRVVTVPVSGERRPEDLLLGLDRPQHLLVDGDALLVSDHATGTIWRVRAEG
jgi:glucose/arabinose dehydrogenase